MNMQNDWQTKKLGDISVINGGGTPPTSHAEYFTGNVPWFTPSEITSGTVSVLTNSERQITEEATKHSKIAEQDTVLLSSRATIGHVGIVANRSTYNQGIKGLTPKKELLPWYLAYWLLANKKKLEKSSFGTTFKELSTTALKKFDIEIPPISVQQQIVEKLDAIKKMQELNQKEITIVKELFNSCLSRAFKPLTGGIIKRLGELFLRSSKTVLPITLGDELVNYIGLENIESNTGRLVSFSPCFAKTIKSAKTKFSKGDTLYGKLRPYLNKVWLATMDGICSTDIWVLKAQENVIRLELLPILLRFPEIVKQTLAGMTGTNLPRVNAKTFDHIEITVLPIEKQKLLIEEIMKIQDYQQSLQTKKEKLSQLFDSALNKFMKSN